jgi:hypothetical protein
MEWGIGGGVTADLPDLLQSIAEIRGSNTYSQSTTRFDSANVFPLVPRSEGRGAHEEARIPVIQESKKLRKDERTGKAKRAAKGENIW